MAEHSQPWSGTLVGHATRAPYDAAEWTEMHRGQFGSTGNRGVCVGHLNELDVDVPADVDLDTVDVDTGEALVYGTWYLNDALLAFTVPAPGVDPRVDYFVVAANFSGGPIIQTAAARPIYDVNGVQSLPAHEVHVMRLQGVEAGAPPPVPTLDQLPAGLFMIPLWHYTVAIDGTTSAIWDQRRYAGGTKFPLVARQGGHATYWDTGGGTTYPPGDFICQVGTHLTASIPDGTCVLEWISYPQEFGHTTNSPLITLGIRCATGDADQVHVIIRTISFQSFRVSICNNTGGDTPVTIHWMAIGPL